VVRRPVERQARQQEAQPRGEVTAPVIIVAILLLLLMGLLGFWLDIYYRASARFGAGVPASGPFALLFLLAAAATLLPLRSRFKPTRRQVLAIYIIVLVGAPVVSYKVMESMLVHATIQRYLGLTTNILWQDTFLNLIPAWLAPADWDAVQAFYHGQSAVPWPVWWTPLAVWCSFTVALAVCSGSLMLLLQRQWISHERLTFPLAQIPLEMVVGSQVEQGPPRARLTSASLFWVGLVVSFVLTALHTLARYAPAIPAVPLGPVTIMAWHPVGPLAGLDEINLLFFPWLIAIAYLIPRDLSFSCWFFWFVRLGLHVAAIASGAAPQRPAFHWVSEFPAPLFQGTGAVLAISALAIWSARRHLGRAARIALSRQSGRADADEPLPYRWTLIAFLLSFGWMVCICVLAGSRLVVGIALIAAILVYYTTWVRLRAETGLGFFPYPLFLHQSIVVPLGTAAFTPREMIMIHAPHWAYHGGGDSFEIVPGNALESMKIGDAAGLKMRPVILAMAAGFVVIVVLGAYLTLTGMYRYGFLNTGPRTIEHELNVYSWSLHDHFLNPAGSDVPGTIAMGAGALVTFLLGAMRLRFWWWPFHPIGYLAAHTWVMYMYWSPFMIGWIAKTLVVRYGGLRLYRATVPLAIGFIAGDLMDEVLWGIVTLATGLPFRPSQLW
jgi:hypothetical protein